MRHIFALLLISCSLATMAQSPEITFTTKNGSDREKAVIPKVQEILSQHDLTKWIFTDQIIIEQFAIPHSHPVLTLSTKPQSQDELLSTLLHEQIHWYLDENTGSEKKAIAEFRKKYTNVPVRNERGASDEYSTYLHLIVCYLEYKSLVELIGQQKAEKVIREKNHYTWIYETVLKDQAYLGKVIAENNLNLVD